MTEFGYHGHICARVIIKESIEFLINWLKTSMLAELTNQTNRRLPEGFEIQVLIINIPVGKSRSNTSLVEFLIFSPCLLFILRCSNPLPAFGSNRSKSHQESGGWIIKEGDIISTQFFEWSVLNAYAAIVKYWWRDTCLGKYAT